MTAPLTSTREPFPPGSAGESADRPANGAGSKRAPTSREDAPVVLVDSREQCPLPVERFLPASRATLYSGDYSILGFEDQFAVERKSIADLTESLSGGRDRFEKELLRLRSMRWKRLLIVGSHLEVAEHQYRSQIAPSAVMGSLAAYEARFDVPVIWQPDEDAAARLVCRWAYYWHREQVRAFQKVRVCTIDYAVGAATMQLSA